MTATTFRAGNPLRNVPGQMLTFSLLGRELAVSGTSTPIVDGTNFWENSITIVQKAWALEPAFKISPSSPPPPFCPHGS